MQPNVAFMPAGLDACAMFRMFMPHLHIPGSLFLYNYHGLDESKFKHCQVAVVQRLCSRTNLAALQTFKRMGMKVVYDLDDDMWSVPPYNPAHKILKIFLPGFNICALESDLITVSTPHLKVIVQRQIKSQRYPDGSWKHCPPIEVVENSMDFDWFQKLPKKHRKVRKDKVVIGWAGTNTHTGDVKKVFDLIPGILREFPQVHFELVGLPIPENWKDVADRVTVRDFVPVAEYPAAWASWQWDLSIAPLEENKFNLSKSSIKLLEAAAVGIPCIASNIGEYNKFCSRSPLLKDTCLADTNTSWNKKIRDLIVDTELRNKVGIEMEIVARRDFNIDNGVNKWQDIFEELVKK